MNTATGRANRWRRGTCGEDPSESNQSRNNGKYRAHLPRKKGPGSADGKLEAKLKAAARLRSPWPRRGDRIGD